MTHAPWVATDYPWAGNTVTGLSHRTQARALVRGGPAVTVGAPAPWAPWPLHRRREHWRVYAAAPATATDQGVAILRPRYLGLPGEIASRVGGIPGLLGDDRGALLPDVSASSVGAALDAFAADRDGARAAARLREFVLAHHDVDANAAHRARSTRRRSDAAPDGDGRHLPLVW